ncbi:MAG: c-type cytochrome [Candidatus Eisenbacteria bacterium]|nr:c-type cytochrome [Candidatus Eisenbacteria bacterium]
MRNLVRAVLLAAVVGVVGFAIVVRADLPAAERGRRLAERSGCFSCHGPGGIKGVANHGRSDLTVPGFEGDVMMFAKNDEELREWIRDGVTARKAKSESWKAASARGALRMPAYGDRFGRRGLDDLVAYVNVMAGNPEPQDSLARAGLERIEALGCIGCHGPGGRLAPRNPGSLKGYVPSWDGRDFAELVRDRREFHQWVADGVSDRFKRNALAMHFLERANLRMPAFKDHLQPGDEDAIWAYVQWLRRTPH